MGEVWVPVFLLLLFGAIFFLFPEAVRKHEIRKRKFWPNFMQKIFGAPTSISFNRIAGMILLVAGCLAAFLLYVSDRVRP